MTTLKKEEAGSTRCSPLVFQQIDAHKWRGRLIRPETLVDIECPSREVQAASFGMTIQEGPGPLCELHKWGADKHAARRTSHSSLEDAQRAAMRWARNRFRRKVY
jgi:hypothetical protein